MGRYILAAHGATPHPSAFIRHPDARLPSISYQSIIDATGINLAEMSLLRGFKRSVAWKIATFLAVPDNTIIKVNYLLTELAKGGTLKAEAC